MQVSHRHQLWILLTAGVVLFSGLNATRLWDEDEAYFAGAAAEMYAHHDWIVPRFNGELFAHKPPWMYWMMMVGYSLFGVSEFAARVFSAVFGTATALLTYHLARRLFTAPVGLLAGLIMVTSLMFGAVSRAATADAYLVFFVTLSLYLFTRTTLFATRSQPDNCVDLKSATAQRSGRSWGLFATMYGVMGIAVLVKGPIGVFFPMAVIGLYLLCTSPGRELPATATRWQRWREAIRPFGPVNFVRTVWRMRPLTATIMVLLVAGPWYWAVDIRTHGAFLHEFIGVHHWQRFNTPMEDHQGGVYYYIVSVVVGLFPWSVISIPGVLLLIRLMRQRLSGHRHLLFALCWVAVYLGIFSLAGTKLPNYVLPAYPALAILAGYCYCYWMDHPGCLSRGWSRVAFGIVMLIGFLFVAGLPVAGFVRFNGRSLLDMVGLARDVQLEVVWLGLVGVPATFGGLISLILAERGHLQKSVVSLAGTAIVSVLLLWNFAAPLVDRYQISEPITAAIQQRAGGEAARIAHYGFFRPSLVFYARQPIAQCASVQEARDFLEQSDIHFLITTDEQLQELQAALPMNIDVLKRRARFPEKGEILLLARARGKAKEPLALAAASRLARR